MPVRPAVARKRLESSVAPEVENRKITFVFGNGAFYYPVWERTDFELAVMCAHQRAQPTGPHANWREALLALLAAKDRVALLALLRRRRVELEKRRDHLTAEQLDEGVWLVNEYFRTVSLDCVGIGDYPPVYWAAGLLSLGARVRGLCTTNYDLSLEAVLAELGVPYVVNPCASRCDARNGFNCDPRPDALCVWKPHGRMDYYAGHPTAVPSHPVPIPEPRIVDIGEIPLPRPRHFHDFNGYARGEHFACETNACCEWLDELGPADIAVVVGFTGHWGPMVPVPEEIAPRLVQAMSRGAKAMMIHRWEGTARSYLWDEVDAHANGSAVKSAGDIWTSFYEVVVKCRALYRPLKPLINSLAMPSR